MAKTKRASQPVPIGDDLHALVKGQANLTNQMWAYLSRDADADTRSVNFVLREIVGNYYGLKASERNPKRSRSGKEN